jgi:3-hydroxyisobutyrate dehydrogenase-like beta-hydroxyacid dehydrogenase
LKLANEKGLKLYLSELHEELMRRAEDEGLGDLDNSAIAEIWR